MFDKILVVAAHADDEILGCGGSLVELTKSSRNNPEIVVLCCDNEERMCKAGKWLMLEKEYYHTCDFLKYNGKKFYKFYREIIIYLEDIMEQVKPDTVFYHFADNHQDHKVVNEIMKIVCRRFNGNMFEYLANMPSVGVEFYPNFYVDITKVWEEKKSALQEYNDRINENKTPLDIGSLENWHRYLGISVGVKYAEAFKMVKGVRKEKNNGC